MATYDMVFLAGVLFCFFLLHWRLNLHATIMRLNRDMLKETHTLLIELLKALQGKSTDKDKENEDE